MNKNIIITSFKNDGLLNRICLRSIKSNQEGYVWIDIKANYYNNKTAEAIRWCLNKNKLYSVYITDYDCLKDTILNKKSFDK